MNSEKIINPGIYIINKPNGWTSFDVVNKLKRFTNKEKIGHAGTLDPAATGVLVVAVGNIFTKQLNTISGQEKVYLAEIILGIKTNTYDLDGEVTFRKAPIGINKAKVESVLSKFEGEIMQVPPIFSALKKDGKRLYEYARKGQEVQIDPRPATIYKMELLEFIEEEYPKLILRMQVSKGTYVRSIAYDLGEELGCGGVCGKLIREAVGPYRIENARELDTFFRYFESPQDLAKYKHCSIAVGAFDGCHLGHQKLLAQADAALTFWPLPKVFFNKNELSLNIRAEKTLLYPNFVYLKFTKRFAVLSSDFFMDLVSQMFAPKKIIVGWDFQFGKDLSGNVRSIDEYIKRNKLKTQVEVVPPVYVQGVIAKSTTIKKFLESDNLVKANEMLGYNYFVLSKVVHGKGVGRKLGFPTLNLELDSAKQLVQYGVYSGRCKVDDKYYKAAISFLIRDGKPELEAHLLDFEDDAYGKLVKLEFVQKLRNTLKFSSIEELKSQIKIDVQKVKNC